MAPATHIIVAVFIFSIEAIKTGHRITCATIAGLCLRVIGLEACESKEVIAIGINTDVVDGHTGYAERITKEKEFEEQYQQNINATLSTLEQMQQEEGISDDEIDQAMEFLIGIMKDGLLGKFTRDSIQMAIKAIKHDSDVETASHEGEVKGRNSKIEEKLRKGSKSDGTANLAGKNGGGNAGSRQMPDLGAISRYDGAQNIWERGGEKRRSINK